MCKCVLVGDQMCHNKTKTQSKPKQSRAEVEAEAEAKAADKAKRNYEKLFTFMLNFL